MTSFERPPSRGEVEVRAILANSGVVETLVAPAQLALLAGELQVGQRLRLEFVRCQTGWRFELALIQPAGEVVAVKQALHNVLFAAAPGITFLTAEDDRSQLLHTERLAPQALKLPAGFGYARARRTVLLAECVGAASHLPTALGLAARSGVERFHFVLRRRRLTRSERETLDAAIQRLYALQAQTGRPTCRRIAALAGWGEAGAGHEVEVAVESAAPIEDAMLAAIALNLFGCAGSRMRDEHAALDLRLCFPIGSLPPWRFWPVAGDLARPRTPARADRKAEPGDVTMGCNEAGDPVFLYGPDREMHCYVGGQTGAGKSVLLGNMLLEDIRSGEGVMLIDPHGDLALSVRRNIPKSRLQDLIWVDPAGTDNAWRIDPFAMPGIDPEAEQDFVAEQLIALVRTIYRGDGNSFGPMFDQYLKNSVLLLLNANDAGDRTPAKLEDVFLDPSLRARLIAECKSARVRKFWRNAEDISNDHHDIASMTPWITSKLTRLTGSPMARRLLAGDNPSLDLRQSMDDGRIVLVRLPKGELGGRTARALGAFCVQALVSAAMSRANGPRDQRRSFRVYIDESQNLTTPDLAEALAECRKYALSLTLGNQSINQPGVDAAAAEVAAATKANCGTFVAFRQGLPDAQYLGSLMELEDPRVLTRLGVGEMIVRRLLDNEPQPAQRLRGLPPVK
jgi:Type IV secretory system Conjugative DNA transfer